MLFALLPVACGARSSLLEARASDAGAEGNPCAPPALDAACAGAIAGAPAGSELWSAAPDVGTLDLLGPVAASDAGDTYYVAAQDALYVKTVIALDACGALRWRTDVSALVAASGYVPEVMVAGGHVLVVGIGSIVALSAATGAHAWTADLDAFAKNGGLGVAPGKVQALGYTAARADGTAFTAVANDQDAWIVAVDAGGKMRPVGKVESYLGGFGYPLGMQQMIVDAAGDVVLAGGENPGAGDRIAAFTSTGKHVYSTALPGWGNSASLAAGPGVTLGAGLWILDGAGNLVDTFTGGGPTFVSWDGPFAVDEAGAIFAVGDEHLDPGVSTVTADRLGRFAPDGSQAWSVTLQDAVQSGPLLGDDDALFVLAAAGNAPGSAQYLACHARGNGAELWRRELPPSGKRPSYWMLMGAAGALTLAVDNVIHAYASGGARPPACAWWPTPRGGIDQRVGAVGPG